MKSRNCGVVMGLVWGLCWGAWSGPGPPSTSSSSPSASWSSPPSSSPSSPLQPEPHDHHSNHQDHCPDLSSRPPSPIPDTPLPINVSLVIANVNSLDLTTAEISWRITLSWPDHRLTHAQNCSSSSPWIPKFNYEYNFVGGKGGQFTVFAKDGEKDRFYATISVTISVSVDYVIHEFPYDSQRIHMKIDFPPYNKDEITIQLDTWKLKDQRKQGHRTPKNPEWLIQNLSCYTGNCRGEGHGHPYFLCTVTVQRKAGYYIVNFVIPAALICLLSISGQFMHELLAGVDSPPNRSQVALAAVTSLGILAVAMGNSAPRQNGMTYLHYFYFTAIVLSISAFITSTIRLGPTLHAFARRLEKKRMEERMEPERRETMEEKELGEQRWHWRVMVIIFLLHIACLIIAFAVFLTPP